MGYVLIQFTNVLKIVNGVPQHHINYEVIVFVEKLILLVLWAQYQTQVFWVISNTNQRQHSCTTSCKALFLNSQSSQHYSAVLIFLS